MKKKIFIACILLYNMIGISVAIGGWLWEVLLFLIKERHFVNRGFLHGPWLPVYGIGAILLSLLFYYKNICVMVTYAYLGNVDYPEKFYNGKNYQKLKRCIWQRLGHLPTSLLFPYRTISRQLDTCKRSQVRSFSIKSGTRRHVSHKTRQTKKSSLINKLRIFFICMLGGGLIEFVAGWLLWHTLQKRYWDYTGYFMDLDGYVCLFSALGFGIFGSIWIQWVAPRLIWLWERIPFAFQILLAGLSDVLLATDIIFSLIQPNSGENITFGLLSLLSCLHPARLLIQPYYPNSLFLLTPHGLLT